MGTATASFTNMDSLKTNEWNLILKPVSLFDDEFSNSGVRTRENRRMQKWDSSIHESSTRLRWLYWTVFTFCHKMHVGIFVIPKFTYTNQSPEHPWWNRWRNSEFSWHSNVCMVFNWERYYDYLLSWTVLNPPVFERTCGHPLTPLLYPPTPSDVSVSSSPSPSQTACGSIRDQEKWESQKGCTE